MIYEKKCRATVHLHIVYKTRKKVKIITKRSVHYCVHKTIDLDLLKVIMECGQFYVECNAVNNYTFYHFASMSCPFMGSPLD